MKMKRTNEKERKTNEKKNLCTHQNFKHSQVKKRKRRENLNGADEKWTREKKKINENSEVDKTEERNKRKWRN